jgi:hypothetical protein
MRDNIKTVGQTTKDFFMRKEMNVSLFWDGLNHYFKMILHSEQNFIDSYIDFVNSNREKALKRFL